MASVHFFLYLEIVVDLHSRVLLVKMLNVHSALTSTAQEIALNIRLMFCGPHVKEDRVEAAGCSPSL